MASSLLVLTRSISVELAPLVINTTTSLATNSTSLVCSSLVNSNANVSQFIGCWVYFLTAPFLGVQREVAREGGFDPDNGITNVSRALSTACSSGVQFQVMGVMPAITDDMGRIGIRECINDTLRSIPPIDLLPVTGVTALGSYDVTILYPWLTEQSQILGIYFQDTTDDAPRPYRTSWGWLYDADAPRLLLPSEPFITGQTFYVKARRPAQSWIKTNGVWAADTDGLQSDTDEALPLLPMVRAQTLATIYRLLGAGQGPDEYVTYYREREGFWSRKAFALRWWDDQKGVEDTTPKLKFAGIGPAYGGRRSYGGRYG